MNILRRVVAAITGKRSFESAGGGSRWPLSVHMASPARQVLAAAPLTRSRSNWLQANVGIAENAVATWANSLIGDGPTVRSNHHNRALRDALEDHWLTEYDRTGIDGSDLTGVLTLLTRSMIGAGEGVARFLVTDSGEVRVQVLSPEQLDASVNRETDDGGRVRPTKPHRRLLD